MTTHSCQYENEPLLSSNRNDHDVETGNYNTSNFQSGLAPSAVPSYRNVHFQPTLSKIASSTSISSTKASTTPDFATNESQKGDKSSSCLPTDDAFYFGARVAILVLVASLFATNQLPLGKDVAGHDIVWPQGMWVTISTLMVCWFPKLDAASVIQKSLQRLGGTLLGGSMGLVCGSLSRQILPTYVYRRAIFLHTAYAFGCFLVTYSSMKIRLSRTSTIMGKYNYGTVLCLLTFTISLFPFLEQEDPWKKAVYRIMNVTLGCMIAAIGSMLVIPRSTTDMLLQRVQKQCQWAGESSEAVLHAAADVIEGDHVGTFPLQGINSGRLPHGAATDPGLSSPRLQRHGSDTDTSQTDSHRLDNSWWSSIRVSVLHRSFHRVHHEILQEGHGMNTALDVVLEKYEAAIRDWKDTKGLFQLFRYDPFHYIVPASQEFRDGCDTILSRALRIQTTVVLLDGIVRNDPQHLLFVDETVHSLLTEMGTLIRKMLSVPRQAAVKKPGGKDAPASSPNDSAKARLLDRLHCFRNVVNQMANSMVQTETLMESIGCGNHHNSNPNNTSQESKQPREDLPCPGRSTVVNVGSKHHALLFLQLVENLTHQSISLYDSWVGMEDLKPSP